MKIMPQRPNITGTRAGFSPRAVAGRELMPKRVGAVKGYFIEHLLGSKEMVGWPTGKSRGIEGRL